MDYSSTAIVEHTVFSLYEEIQIIKSIKEKLLKKNVENPQKSRIRLWISTMV